mgnify:CR=1 FL=1|tara:strand:- start:1153 stop:1320 length:168 start_codon:yes stop_codon:yes gene_type:complete
MELHDRVAPSAEYAIRGDTLMALRDIVIELYRGNVLVATDLDQILTEVDIEKRIR